ncbi:MAG: DNA-formamidopyrimidine glycosylase [Candidatus Phytoplasma pyri]
MPELPEVEVVVRSLKKNLINKKIINIKVFYEPIVGKLAIFKKILNQKILNLTRKGKYLIFFFSNELVLVGHLRMEGKLYFKPSDEIIIKHEHFILFLENNISLRFNDTRKFGRFIVYDQKNYLQCSKLDQLALEPFEFSTFDFYQILKNKKKSIKNSLLDQKIISGLGNIYANEVLFLSKIHPANRSCDITFEQAEKILKYAKKIFKQSILLGGTSINTFDSLGIKGSFQKKLLVHGKEKQACLVCCEPIIKIKLGGRGTYFCSKCQIKI